MIKDFCYFSFEIYLLRGFISTWQLSVINKFVSISTTWDHDLNEIVNIMNNIFVSIFPKYRKMLNQKLCRINSGYSYLFLSVALSVHPRSLWLPCYRLLSAVGSLIPLSSMWSFYLRPKNEKRKFSIIRRFMFG